jgi:hypothetical protein
VSSSSSSSSSAAVAGRKRSRAAASAAEQPSKAESKASKRARATAPLGLSSLTVVTLKACLKKAKLSTKGRKADLVQRLAAHRLQDKIQRNREAARLLQKLTREQKAVMSLVKPPMNLAPGMEGASSPKPASAASTDSRLEHRVVRVMSAAGSGKTTVLLAIIRRLLQRGHRHVVYCVYNKANAKEAREKTILLASDFNAVVTCETIDALARRAVLRAKSIAEPKSNNDVVQLILIKFKHDIENFLGTPVAAPGPDNLPKFSITKCKTFVARTIFQTLARFLRGDMRASPCPQPTPQCPRSPCSVCQAAFSSSSSSQSFSSSLQSSSCCCKDDYFQVVGSKYPPFGLGLYYPAKLWHSRDVSMQRDWHLRCPVNLPSLHEARAWYAERARDMWDAMREGELYTYDSIAKLAQLQESHIWRASRENEALPPPTACCVDEAQDLNPAKFDWLAQQARRMQIFFVGDAMQQIYHFNGSRSSNMMQLGMRLARLLPSGCTPNNTLTCRTMTESFRFGPEIAHAANVMIMAKEKSKQKRCFYPYRVVGSGNRESFVTEEDLLHRRDAEGKFVRISEEYGGCLTVLCRTNVSMMIQSLKLLSDDPTVRIALNGESTTTGRRKFLKVYSELEPFYNVYAGFADRLPFKEWRNVTGLTWSAVEIDILEGEAKDYSVHLHVISAFGDDERRHECTDNPRVPYEDSPVYAAVSMFKSLVLDCKHRATDAEVIFSTIHVAKGLEWNVVQVSWEVDLKKFPLFLCDRSANSAGGGFVAAGSQRDWHSAGFGFKTGSTEDEVNLLYVALTRAKDVLSVPRTHAFAKLLRTLERCRSARASLTDPEFDLFKEAQQFRHELFNQEDSGLLGVAVQEAVFHCEEVCEQVLGDDQGGEAVVLPAVRGREEGGSSAAPLLCDIMNNAGGAAAAQ